MLTLASMPWLDLGELPISYNSSKTEAYQVYLIPSNDLPSNLVIEYKSWTGFYDQKHASKSYAQTALSDRGITSEDIQETLS